jgi:hypothetical protein
MKRRKLLLSMLFIAIMGIMANTTMANPYTEGEETGWKAVGPNNYSGRTRAAVFDKFNDGVIYVGSVGGLYVSVNYGKNWQEISLGDAVQNVTAIAQGEDGRLYIGTGEGYYEKMIHGENSIGYSNQTSGSVGGGVFMQTSGVATNWAEGLADDNAKYAYIKANFAFSVMANTKPYSKYAFSDDWAYINTILYSNGALYVGTKNGGLKYTTDIANPNATFENITIDGNASFNVSDLQVNTNGVVAVAYDQMVAVGNGKVFNVIFSSEADPNNVMSGYGMGRIKLAFAEKTPNDLFIFVSASLSKLAASQYEPDLNGYIYGIYRPYTQKIGGSLEDNVDITTLTATETNWHNIVTSSMTAIAGSSLGYGMSIYVDDRTADQEIVYLGGSELLYGQDYNKEGRFSFSQLTSASSQDTLGTSVGINIHNILPMPKPLNREMTAYDSLYLFVTSDMGAFRYEYDTVLTTLSWVPAFGMNNLQAYKVSATADGSIIAATQSNAIVYLPTVSDSVKRGTKIWSVNNANYPYTANSTTYTDFQTTTYSGSGVNASTIYRTSPTVRKPIIVSRPGTNLARSYSNSGDFSAIDDQTWTYGGGSEQTFLTQVLMENLTFDPFNTPTAFWEKFDFEGTIDSVEMTLNDYTIIRRNGEIIDGRSGVKLVVGDSILVQSDNVDYPFYHVMTKSDTMGIAAGYDENTYTLGTDDTILQRNDGMVISVPQPIQARLLVATNIGAYICGKVLDFSRTVNPNALAEGKFGNLIWAKLFSTGSISSSDDYSTMNTRIHAVALSEDGSSAFLAVDKYSSYDTYDNTLLVRVSGLNDVSIVDDHIINGGNGDIKRFTTDTIATFTRPIASIVCDPKNSNNMTLTFEGAIFSAANVMQTTNALDATVDFTDISLNIDRTGATATNDKPVFTALYESVNEGNANSGRLYVGSDDGIYYRLNGKWYSDNDNMPSIPVFNLWQQTKKLPKWVFYAYTGDNAELNVYNATENTGVIYAATYGRGIYVNNDFKDTVELKNPVSILDVKDNKEAQSLVVYPNPAVNEATISYTLDENSNVEFRMYDLNGKEVSSFNSGVQAKGSHYQMIDVSKLQRGSYVIQMVTKSNTMSARLIVK